MADAAPDTSGPVDPADATFASKVNQAEQMIAAGHLTDARARLEQLEKQRPRDMQTQFLLALLDRQEKDYESAIRRFHRILVDEPTAVRVRLELGRTFFESGDYANAERQFRFARAGKLPPAVLRNVDNYLFAIRGRKTFTFGFSLAIAPDTNLNAGPATDTVSLYGLPFQLSQNAKANSGVGLVVDGSAEWAPRLSKTMKFRIGTQLHRAQYRVTDFDDMTLGFYAGPRVNLRRWEFNLLGNVARRWYGDHVYTNMAGGSADTTYFLNRRVGIGVGLNLFHLQYVANPDQSGYGGNVAFNLFYTPTPASFVRATVQVGQLDARLPAYANHSYQLGIIYVREIAGGITIGLSPTYTRIGYDAPLAAFNATRIDHQYSGQITLLSRRIDIHGLTPRLAYTYTRNDSSISLYRFSRSRVEIGVTSAF
ncbi:MAG: hypothetical protein JWR80_5212 [Bradyrhizobium sp.]|nr:hypothetical protein [Bradyrhizobium sp.]